MAQRPGWRDSAAACFVIAGCFLFATVRRLFDSTAAAGAALALFALNPNVLYLQSIPMTEAVFFAALMALLYFSVRFGETQGWGAAVGAALSACAATLTRYDGWFLLPVVAAYFLFAARKRIACDTGILRHRGARSAVLAGPQLVDDRRLARFLPWPVFSARHSGRALLIPGLNDWRPRPSITAPRRGFAPGRY